MIYSSSECNPRETGKIKISTCSASSEHDSDHTCEKAFDADKSNAEWAISSEAQGVGSWIKIEFKGLYRVTKVKTYPRSTVEEMFKNISLEFEDGTIENFALGTGVEWSELILTETAASKFVKIKGLEVYGDQKNGFREVEVFGCPIGKLNYPEYMNCHYT